jgi:hypothetical protein
MARPDAQTASREAWALAKRQHWVITWWQLIELGYTREAIAYRIEEGQLFPLWRGVYAVRRRDLSREGLFMAAVLACRKGAVLSHVSAAILWGILKPRRHVIEVTVIGRHPRQGGIEVHRRKGVESTRPRTSPSPPRRRRSSTSRAP